MVIQKIDSRCVSIVFQGPIVQVNDQNITLKAIMSAKRYFPDSPIILSTHDNQDFGEIEGVKIIYTRRYTGDFEDESKKISSNLNSMIETAKNGINQVKTEYAMKIRSDMIFKSDRLLRILVEKKLRPTSKYNISSMRIIFSNLTAVNPNYVLKLPHHPCDSFQAGKTVDLKELWNIPFISTAEINYFRYMTSHPTFFRKNLLKYRNEAWVWYHYIRNYLEFGFDNSHDCRLEVINESNEIMARNIRFFSLPQLGIKSAKNKYKLKSRAKMMTHLDWINICRVLGVPSDYKIDIDSIKVYLLRRLLFSSRIKKVYFSEIYNSQSEF
jgi:hypothetical protein